MHFDGKLMGDKWAACWQYAPNVTNIVLNMDSLCGTSAKWIGGCSTINNCGSFSWFDQRLRRERSQLIANRSNGAIIIMDINKHNHTELANGRNKSSPQILIICGVRKYRYALHDHKMIEYKCYSDQNTNYQMVAHTEIWPMSLPAIYMESGWVWRINRLKYNQYHSDALRPMLHRTFHSLYAFQMV